MQQLLEQPVALLLIVGLLFVCWAPLVSDLLRIRRRTRRHRAVSPPNAYCQSPFYLRLGPLHSTERRRSIMRLLLTFALARMLVLPLPSAARGGGVCGHLGYGSRDVTGTIRRSAAARHKFLKTHPCPATGKTTGPCHGYVIDHVVPLKRGGADSPDNLQWQTKEAAKAKEEAE